jgi:hypothetical protein
LIYAANIEWFLTHEMAKVDLHPLAYRDIAQRFESLRGYRLLPSGRGKTNTPLTEAHVVAALLSLATKLPGYAGLAALTLKDLRPVGGLDASFEMSPSLGAALAKLLTDPEARQSLLEVRVSVSEVLTNSHCRASISYRDGQGIKIAHYVSRNATSLFQPGAEDHYDPYELMSNVTGETAFLRTFFYRLVRELKREHAVPVDPEGESEEERKEARAKKVGLVSGSRFLNVGVDNQVTWPLEETVFTFERHRMVLMPKTKETTTSIHVDLYREQLSPEAASTLMNRFLSLMSWCDDQYAVLQDGWAGNPMPVAVPKRDLAFTTAPTWLFDRKVPPSVETRKALALYREGCNAAENYLISFAVLSFYKIIELKHKGKSEAKTWFRNNFERLRADKLLTKQLAEFEKACGTEKVHDHLYRACRTAVAHANKPFSSDPDDYLELRRLHVAAGVLRPLARLFIKEELGVSDCRYDGT